MNIITFVKQCTLHFPHSQQKWKCKISTLRQKQVIIITKDKGKKTSSTLNKVKVHLAVLFRKKENQNVHSSVPLSASLFSGHSVANYDLEKKKTKKKHLAQ